MGFSKCRTIPPYESSTPVSNSSCWTNSFSGTICFSIADELFEVDMYDDVSGKVPVPVGIKGKNGVGIRLRL